MAVGGRVELAAAPHFRRREELPAREVHQHLLLLGDDDRILLRKRITAAAEGALDDVVVALRIDDASYVPFSDGRYHAISLHGFTSFDHAHSTMRLPETSVDGYGGNGVFRDDVVAPCLGRR